MLTINFVLFYHSNYFLGKSLKLPLSLTYLQKEKDNHLYAALTDTTYLFHKYLIPRIQQIVRVLVALQTLRFSPHLGVF